MRLLVRTGHCRPARHSLALEQHQQEGVIKVREHLHRVFAILAVGLFGLSQPAAASTYFLNQSNTLADGVNYAQVDVLENGNNLDFTVTALVPTNWKFSNFYFNLAGDPGTVSIIGGPAWTVDAYQNISVFGLFSDGE